MVFRGGDFGKGLPPFYSFQPAPGIGQLPAQNLRADGEDRLARDFAAEVAEAAAEALRAKYPSLCLCGTHHGYFDKTQGSSENQAVRSLLREAKPEILFVCFGAPAQERWISENTEEIPSLRLCMGLGGALDVWSGGVRRAPKFIQKCGFEWLWRALSEPKRFKRLATIPKFLWEIITN